MAKLLDCSRLILLSPLPDWVLKPDLSVTYSRMLSQIVEEQGIPIWQLLDHAGLARNIMDDPAGKISLVDAMRIVDAAIQLTSDSLLGFKTGTRMPLTAHGNLGIALMCAPTPRVAIETLERFWHLRGRGVQMTKLGADESLFFELSLELPLAKHLGDLWLSSMLSSMCHGLDFMLPGLSANREIWLKSDEPESFQRLTDFPFHARFGMPCFGLAVFGECGWLDTPMPTANPEGYSQAVKQCEREVFLMDASTSILRQVRALLVADQQGYPHPDVVAEMLHITPRTLRRRLQDHGCNYKTLLEEARRRDSCQLLAHSNLEINRISDQLGYGDPANFTRAFKAWTGMTPSVWRRNEQDREA